MGVNAVQCMKCGKEIYADCVFCQECLTEMEKYPIKPGTVVTIPKQPERKKAPARPAVTPEQRIEGLRRRIRVLSWLLTVTLALLISLGALTFTLMQETEEAPAIGQNYSSETEPSDHLPGQSGADSQDPSGSESTGVEATDEADVSRETIQRAPE